MKPFKLSKIYSDSLRRSAGAIRQPQKTGMNVDSLIEEGKLWHALEPNLDAVFTGTAEGKNWFELAKVFRAASLNGLSLRALNNALASLPNTAKLHNAAGKLLADHQNEAAAHHFIEAMKMTSESTKLRARRSVMDMPPETALPLLTRAVAEVPDRAILRLMLGWHLVKDGRAEEAKKHLQVARPFLRKDAALWLALGKAYGALGRTLLRNNSLTKAIHLVDSADPALARDLAEELETADMTEHALKVWLVAMVEDESSATRRRFISLAAKPSSPPIKRFSLPLALITQVQRSGGTLLSQLLDNHPQIFSHPQEIQIGMPRKWNWPHLNLSDNPEEWFAILFERRLPMHAAQGYAKADHNAKAAREIHPFDFDIIQMCRSFLSSVQETPPKTQRDILDAYFSAYFASWKDYRVTGQEKWIAGFSPRLISNRESVVNLRTDYPDGVIICCLRDPWSWFASCRRHHPEYADITHAIALWKTSILSAWLAFEQEKSSVHLLTYTNLVENTEAEMRRLSSRLNIEFRPTLLQPTLLGRPILANSSYLVGDYGVHRTSLDGSKRLRTEENDYIEREAGELYREISKIIANSSKPE
jgi:tetratricopeptide (TPR) repeat protein